MMLVLFVFGLPATFCSPINYSIRPHPLKSVEVLAGTGLVEAGTYIAILAGTILAGVIDVEWAALGVVLVAGLGYWTGRKVPPAPPEPEETGIDRHLTRPTDAAVRGTTQNHRPFPANLSTRTFRSVGTVIFFPFPDSEW